MFQKLANSSNDHKNPNEKQILNKKGFIAKIE